MNKENIVVPQWENQSTKGLKDMQEVAWQSQQLNCLLSCGANASVTGQAAWAGEKPSLWLPCCRLDWEKKQNGLERDGKEVILVVKLQFLNKREEMVPN